MIKSQFVKKLTNIFVTLALLLNASGLATFSNPSTARAAEVCVNDQQGGNDVPGQKDLTQLCFDGVAVAGKVTASWQWDDIDWSGNNSGDACALFDTDGDGKANRALCISLNGSPASLTSIKAYTCTDSSVSRCGSPNSSVNATLSTCSIATNGVQPFALGSASPNDTIASSTIDLSEVGKASAQLFDVCSYPSQQPNSDPSDCINFATSTPSTIEVKKVSNDPSGVFDLLVGGVTVADDIGNGYTTGPQAFDPASYVVSEAGNASSPLANYTSTYLCVDSSGATITSGSGVSTTVNLTANGKTASIVCTFTNTRATGPITVVKDVVNDNGGTKTFADFHYSVNGGPAQSFTATTSPDGSATLNLPTGVPVTITEPEANTMGYTTSYSNCVITPVNNQQQTCTITNDDNAPNLTLNKIVNNSFGGNNPESDWTLTANGGSAGTLSGTGAAGDSDVVSTSSFKAGTYTLSESGPTGYGATDWTCTGNGVQSGNTISLDIGQSAVCNITNTANQPTLTLQKIVTNDDGGTLGVNDFGITINDSALSWDSGTANGSSTTYKAMPSVNANQEYTLNESDVAGYEEGSWTCDNVTSTAVRTAAITLSEGQSMTCTIGNDDIAPYLVVIKQLLNNNGGSATSDQFVIRLNATPLTGGVTNAAGSETAYDTTVSADVSYTIAEDPFEGYTFMGLSDDSDCVLSEDGGITIRMDLGGSYTCTLQNTDIPVIGCMDPGSTVVTEDTQFADYQDTRSKGHYEFKREGLRLWTEDTTSQSKVAWYNAVTPYPLSEVGTPSMDYTATFGIKPGMQIVIDTNGDATPEGILVGEPDYYGNNWWSNTDFGVGSGMGYASYGTLVQYLEAHPTARVLAVGFSLGSGVHAEGMLRAITFGCYTWYFRQAPKLSVVKNVVNDNGGNITADAFTLFVNDSDLANPIMSNDDLTATYEYGVIEGGTYTVSEETNDGYEGSLVTCTDDDSGEGLTHPFVVGEGQRITCTVTNNDLPVIIDISKIIVSDNGGTAAIGDFDISVNGVEVDNFLGNPYFEGLYFGSASADAHSEISVTEATVDGYENTLFVCSVLDGESYRVVEDMSEDTPGYQLEGTPGQSFFCSLVNDDIAVPSITVVKSGPLTAAAGSTITYTFTITNTGNTLLDIDSVSDDIAGDASYVSGDTDGDGLLDLSEVWIFTANYTIPAGQTANVVNTVTACAYEAFDEWEERVHFPLAEVIRTPDSCDTDTHTLKVPATIVLSTPPKLSNTGVSSTVTMLVSGIILAAVAAVEVVRRRSQHE